MHEIMPEANKLSSLSLFVGTGKCNANCTHCAGRIHRKYAPREDGVIDCDLINKTLRECYAKGARSLSISSSGEPTLSPRSVTKALELVERNRKEGIDYSQVNLYSNGIRIGEDKEFCDRHLTFWRSLGLKTMYVTVHDTDEKNNAKVYGIPSYPSLELVISRIHQADMLMRANLVLSKKTIGTAQKFISTVTYLRDIGANHVSAWPIRNLDDKVDTKLSPDESELDKMENWILINAGKNPEYKVKLLREKNRDLYQTGQKLTLFPDGKLSNTWCNYNSQYSS